MKKILSIILLILILFICFYFYKTSDEINNIYIDAIKIKAKEIEKICEQSNIKINSDIIVSYVVRNAKPEYAIYSTNQCKLHCGYNYSCVSLYRKNLSKSLLGNLKNYNAKECISYKEIVENF